MIRPRITKLREALERIWGRASFDYGNRCGHDPLAMRTFTPPAHHEPKPPILSTLIGKVALFAANPKLIPEIAFRHVKGYLTRSELRESISLVLGCLIHYTDLVTLRVMKPQNDGTWVGLSNCEIAELTALSLRRVERAMVVLKEVGWVKVHRTYEEIEDKVYRGRAAIRRLSKHVFAYFGLGRKLEKERAKAYARVRDRAENPPERTKAYASLQMNKSQARARLKAIQKDLEKAADLDTPQQANRDPP